MKLFIVSVVSITRVYLVRKVQCQSVRHKKTKSIQVYLFMEFAESYVLIAAMEVLAREAHDCSASLVKHN